MQRSKELDYLRGALMILLTINHIPSPLRNYTNQPFGLVSAAEGFVLISAYLVGLINSRILIQKGYSGLQTSLWKRIRMIYFGHLITLGFTFIVIGHYLGHLTPFRNFIHFYLETPRQALITAGMLLYQPPMLDILPIYIGCLAITSGVFKLAQRWSWRSVWIGSFIMWIIAQLGLRQKIISILSFIHPIDLGAFDWFAWQFLWISGLWLGARAFQLNHHSFTFPPWLKVGCLLGAMGLFVFRHFYFSYEMSVSVYGWLLQKWTLGPVRLINIFVLSILIMIWGSRVCQIAFLQPILKPLALLGRNSLPVFCFHLCISILGIGCAEIMQLGPWSSSLLVLVQIAVLFLFGWLWQEIQNALAVQITMPPSEKVASQGGISSSPRSVVS